MTPIILLSSNGKVLYCPEWPIEFDYDEIQESGHSITEAKEHYKTLINTAITNGIEFKNKEDCHELKYQIWWSQTDRKTELFNWQLEPLKSYAIPAGIEIEIIDHVLLYGNSQIERIWKPVDHKDHYSKNVEIKKFAFIKPRPKEETQDELWEGIIDLIMLDTGKVKEELKSKFRIERIK